MWLIRLAPGDYGSTNDIAVIYPQGKAPIVLAIYTRQPTKDAKGRSDIIVRAAKTSLATLIH
jgi:beta-lactamase class A